jgi:Uma2 family endonuclease
MPKNLASKKPETRKPLPGFPDDGQPTWEVASLFPAQGTWTDADYFGLDSLHGTFPLVELANGRLEVLSMPTELHQLIVVFLFEMLKAFTQDLAPGVVLVAGLRVRLGKRKYRDPDIVYMRAEHAHRRQEKYWDGADLVMEVVSPDPSDRERDLVIKVREYARARIPEYWIIDPEEQVVRVLTLEGKSYKLHGEFRKGSKATSVLLPGFGVAVDSVLAPPGSKQRKE